MELVPVWIGQPLISEERGGGVLLNIKIKLWVPQIMPNLFENKLIFHWIEHILLCYGSNKKKKILLIYKGLVTDGLEWIRKTAVFA
jgi:hypothetical protein